MQIYQQIKHRNNMSLTQKINNLTGLPEDINFGIKKSSGFTKRPSIFSSNKNRKPRPKSKPVSAPSAFNGLGSGGIFNDINSFLNNQFGLPSVQNTQPVYPTHNGKVINRTLKTNITPRTNTTPKKNNNFNKNVSLTEADKQAVIRAGMAGGLTLEQATSIANGGKVPNSRAINIRANNTSITGPNAINQNTKPLPPPVLDKSGSDAILNAHGLVGTSYDFTGMTNAEANKAAIEAKNAINNQTSSANTSNILNKQTIAGVQKTARDFNTSLGDTKGHPFKTNTTIADSIQIKVDSFAGQFAKNFTSVEDFNAAQNNPEFMAIMQDYLKAGGTLAQISAKIPKDVQGLQPATDTSTFLQNLNKNNTDALVTGFVDNIDGTTTNILSDGSVSTVRNITNKDGSISQIEVKDQQSYIDNLPQTSVGQREIARLNGITNDKIDLYFGTPEKIGILQQKEDEARAAKELIAKQELDAENTAREQAQLNIDKNKHDIQIAQAKIEQERLKAKNYITGYLSKLGALNTTGAAGVMIATLDQKYQAQSSELSSNLIFANRQINIDLNTTINKIQTDSQDEINSINNDLTKSESDIQKEINKSINDANSKIYVINSKIATSLAKNKEDYINQINKNAVTYSKEYMSLAKLKLSNSQIKSILGKNGIVDVSKVSPKILKLLSGKSGTATGSNLFSPNDLRKLNRAGINPNTQRKKAIDFINNQSSANIKPKFTGESLDLTGNKGKRIIRRLIKKSGGKLKANDLIKISQDLDKGFSLKQIAEATGMSTEIFNLLSTKIE